jgi:hypothetical protein
MLRSSKAKQARRLTALRFWSATSVTVLVVVCPIHTYLLFLLIFGLHDAVGKVENFFKNIKSNAAVKQGEAGTAQVSSKNDYYSGLNRSDSSLLAPCLLRLA